MVWFMNNFNLITEKQSRKQLSLLLTTIKTDQWSSGVSDEWFRAMAVPTDDYDFDVAATLEGLAGMYRPGANVKLPREFRNEVSRIIDNSLDKLNDVSFQKVGGRAKEFGIQLSPHFFSYKSVKGHRTLPTFWDGVRNTFKVEELEWQVDLLIKDGMQGFSGKDFAKVADMLGALGGTEQWSRLKDTWFKAAEPEIHRFGREGILKTILGLGKLSNLSGEVKLPRKISEKISESLALFADRFKKEDVASIQQHARPLGITLPEAFKENPFYVRLPSFWWRRLDNIEDNVTTEDLKKEVDILLNQRMDGLDGRDLTRVLIVLRKMGAKDQWARLKDTWYSAAEHEIPCFGRTDVVRSLRDLENLLEPMGEDKLPKAIAAEFSEALDKYANGFNGKEFHHIKKGAEPLGIELGERFKAASSVIRLSGAWFMKPEELDSTTLEYEMDWIQKIGLENYSREELSRIADVLSGRHAADQWALIDVDWLNAMLPRFKDVASDVVAETMRNLEELYSQIPDAKIPEEFSYELSSAIEKNKNIFTKKELLDVSRTADKLGIELSKDFRALERLKVDDLYFLGYKKVADAPTKVLVSPLESSEGSLLKSRGWRKVAARSDGEEPPVNNSSISSYKKIAAPLCGKNVPVQQSTRDAKPDTDMSNNERIPLGARGYRRITVHTL